MNQLVNGVCNMLSPFVGQNSQWLSLIALVVTGVFVLMWWLNESKEGAIIWFLRFAVSLGVLINLFSLPPLIGLPGICGGG